MSEHLQLSNGETGSETQHAQGIARKRTFPIATSHSYDWSMNDYDPRCETFEKMPAEHAQYRARNSWRGVPHRDDYGIEYFDAYHGETCNASDQDSDCHSLDWDSTFDPFVSACFRRGSLTLDPAAFDSTMSVNTTTSTNTSSANIKLKKSADALRDFGKRVIPRIKRKSKDQEELLDMQSINRHRPTISNSSNTFSSVSSGERTRSNTLDSLHSLGSLKSKFSLTSPTANILLPKARTPTSAVSSPTPLTTAFGTSESIDQGVAPGLRATLINNTSTPGIDNIEHIRSVMRTDDEAFEAREKSMRASGWCSEQEIEDLITQRLIQHARWQHELDIALKDFARFAR